MMAGDKLYSLDEIFDEAVSASQFVHVSEKRMRKALQDAYTPYFNRDDVGNAGYEFDRQYVECVRLGLTPIVFFPGFASYTLWSAFGTTCCLCGEVNNAPSEIWRGQSQFFARKLFCYSYDGNEGIFFGPSALCIGCDVIHSRDRDKARGKVIEKIFSATGRLRVQKNRSDWERLRFDPRMKGEDCDGEELERVR